MKQAILTLLSSLMNALKSDSVNYHKDMLPLIQNSIEPGSVCIFCPFNESFHCQYLTSSRKLLCTY